MVAAVPSLDMPGGSDNHQNILITGWTRSSDLPTTTGAQQSNRGGDADAFVVKLDTDGNLIWAKQFGGPGDTVPQASVLEIDANNNVIICGLFNNTVDFDPGPGTFTLTSTAHLQAYIVKLAGNGNLIWAKQFGNSPVVYSGSHISDIRCDAQGNIFYRRRIQRKL